jgi:hypothetical protein
MKKFTDNVIGSIAAVNPNPTLFESREASEPYSRGNGTVP